MRAAHEDPAAKGLISFDGLHPNDSGHKAIADALRLLGYQPLARAGTGVPCRIDWAQGEVTRPVCDLHRLR